MTSEGAQRGDAAAGDGQDSSAHLELDSLPSWRDLVRRLGGSDWRCVLLVDLSGFAYVNHDLGPQIGDRFLWRVGGACVGPSRLR